MHNKPAVPRLDNKKSKPHCNKCNEPLERIPRTPFMKTVLFWLPIRNYFCYRCMTKKVLLKKQVHNHTESKKDPTPSSSRDVPNVISIFVDK